MIFREDIDEWMNDHIYIPAMKSEGQVAQAQGYILHVFRRSLTFHLYSADSQVKMKAIISLLMEWELAMFSPK